MSFNPLGSFDPGMPIQQKLIDAAREYRDRLPICPPGTIYGINGHWTVGHKGQDFPDYNGSVATNDDGSFSLHIPHDPRDNAVGVNSNTPAYHTWLRNTGYLGIATDDMVFGSEHDFGPEPLTIAALQWLCTGVAGMAARYSIDLAGTKDHAPYAGEPTFMTHAECAVRGGNPVVSGWYNYGPSGSCERWDLATFVPLPDGLSVTDEMATTCGNALRLLSHRIKIAAFG